MYPADGDRIQIFAHGVVDVDLLELLVPVTVERSPVGRPHLRRHLQRGAEHYRFSVVTIGVPIVHLADEHPIKVHPALVKASGHPQLQIGVERVVLHGAVGSRVHLGVRTVHRSPKRRLLSVRTRHRDGEIGERGAGPLDRVQVDAAALDAALHHAVAHTGPGQLHDHVGRAQQQRHPHQRVVELRRPPRPAPGDRRLAHRALDMPDRFADRHRTPAR